MKEQDRPLGPNNPQPASDHQLSDTQKVVQQHLKDEHHQITDEEMRNVKISTDHINLDAATQELENKDLEAGKGSSDLDEKFVTPWDVTT